MTQPMQNIQWRLKRSTLEKRANNHGLTIRNDGEDSYMLADISTSILAAPRAMTLEQIANWLDDLDAQNAE